MVDTNKSVLTQWEYKIFKMGSTKVDDLTKFLNEKGKEGWEFVFKDGQFIVAKKPK